MAEPGRALSVPVVLTLAGGLAALLSGAAPWLSQHTSRDIDGLAIGETVLVAGTVPAPAVVPLALAAVLLGGLLGVARGVFRRAAAALLGVLGLAGMLAAATGMVRVAEEPGRLTAAPFASMAAFLVVALGAVGALRLPARPPLRTRYSVEAARRPVDAEWDLAAGDDDR